MFGKQSHYGEYSLRAFVLRTVNGVKPQQRPQLVCEATAESVKRVADYMAERAGARIQARSIARELGGILHYGDKMLPARPMPGGWEAQRLSFMLSVDLISPLGLTSTISLAGYTDGMPERRDDRVDWNGVMFYVNSCLVEHRSVTKTIDGDRQHSALRPAEHFIYDVNFGDAIASAKEVRVSPADATNAMTTLHLQAENMHDTRTMVTSMARAVYRRHVIPSRYLAELMRAYFQAHELDTYGSTEDNVLSQMRGYLDTSPLTTNPLVRTFSHAQGFPFAGQFTMQDLCHVLPAVADKAVVAFEDYAGPEEDSPVDERANQVLVYLGQTVPALFHSMGFSSAQFQVDIPYHDEEEPIKFTFVNTRGFAGTTDSMERIKHVEKIMSREILPDGRRMGCEGGSLFFNVEVFGNSSIQYNLLFGTSRQGKRHFASYADALTSPLTTDSQQSGMALAADLYAILNAALDASASSQDENDPFII